MLNTILLQDASVIDDKIENAPDNAYQIGVFIGSYLPLLILVVIAYLIYRYNKRNKE